MWIQGSLGAIALWGAVTASGAAVGCGAWAWRAGEARWTKSVVAATEMVSVAAVGLASITLGALIWSLLTGNFAVEYVADTTTRQGAWYYRLSGLWGGNGGSLLLWGWIILAVAVWATRRSPAARVIATAIGGSVLLIAAVAADPFQRLQIPAIDGGGLNPILQYRFREQVVPVDGLTPLVDGFTLV